MSNFVNKEIEGKKKETKHQILATKCKESDKKRTRLFM